MAIHDKYRVDNYRVIESSGADLPARRALTDPAERRVFKDEHAGVRYAISGRSFTPRSFATAIRPCVGESEAYKRAMLKGEIGLQRAFGVNVRGADFISAVREDRKGILAVVCTDVKTSGIGEFPEPKPRLPGDWKSEAISSVLRLSQGHGRLSVLTTDLSGPPLHSWALPTTGAELEEMKSAIVDAIKHDRIAIRQLTIDASPTGQWSMEGWDDLR